MKPKVKDDKKTKKKPVLETQSGEERIIDRHNTILIDDQCNITDTFSSGEDNTKDKSAEEEIKAIQQQMEFVLGVTKTGLDIIDSKFNIRYINPEWEKVYGNSSGRKCYEYFMGRDEICPGCGIPKALETKTVTVTEEVLVKEGNRPIQVTTIPFQDDKGEWLVAEVNVDITESKRAEEELRKARDELEIRVKERTAELVTMTEQLKQEIEERKKTEEALEERERELETKTHNLEEANIALNVLLKKREEDKTELEEKILLNIKELIIPYLEKLKKNRLDEKQEAYLSILESNLNEITSSFSHRLSSKFLNFTPTEIQIANLLQQGKTSKEIAELINSSPKAVAFHRENIRSKLGLKNKKINLKSYLLSLT